MLSPTLLVLFLYRTRSQSFAVYFRNTLYIGRASNGMVTKKWDEENHVKEGSSVKNPESHNSLLCRGDILESQELRMLQAKSPLLSEA
jgi:hypothetical protein